MNAPQHTWAITCTLLLAFLVGMSPSTLMAIDVAICGAAFTPNRNIDVQQRLQSTGQFNTVDVISVCSTTPTLAELQAYDAVLVYSNDPYADPETLGNVLADYHDAGGGVVCAVFEVANSSGGAGPDSLKGRWQDETYYVIERGQYVTGQAFLGTVSEPSHPVMAGVTFFDGGGASYRPMSTSLTPGARLLAEWSDGKILAAVKCVDERSRVDLGFYPPSHLVASGGWMAGSGGELLMANAYGPDNISGTEDDDLRLMPGSPCIDAGNNAAPGLVGVTTDLDGLPRFIDDPDAPDNGIGDPPIVDMGAYEYGRDCNGNGTLDTADILNGTSADWNGN